MSLSDELHKIDAAITIATGQVYLVGDLLDEMKDEYDLYDFSIDHLEKWENDFNQIIYRLENEHKEFERFAFDGDSIREVDKDEDQ